MNHSSSWTPNFLLMPRNFFESPAHYLRISNLSCAGKSTGPPIPRSPEHSAIGPRHHLTSIIILSPAASLELHCLTHAGSRPHETMRPRVSRCPEHPVPTGRTADDAIVGQCSHSVIPTKVVAHRRRVTPCISDVISLEDSFFKTIRFLHIV